MWIQGGGRSLFFLGLKGLRTTFGYKMFLTFSYFESVGEMHAGVMPSTRWTEAYVIFERVQLMHL